MTSGTSYGELFSRGARDWARFIESQFWPLYNAVQERLAIKQGTRLLDIGCGTGGAAVLAARRGARVTGLDSSTGSVELAQERLPEADFRVGDMEALPWPDASFDAVTGINSFQFAKNATTALTEARRVLAPGGRLGMVIWAPPEQSDQSKVIQALRLLAPTLPPDEPGPFALSQSDLAESRLDAAGLQLVDCGEIPTIFEFPDAEAACGAMMAGSAGARAVQYAGEERARQTIMQALEEYRQPSGGYRYQNLFRYLIAEQK